MTKIEELYEHFRQHPHIFSDSRKVIEGGIFFALKGDSFNGNAYASSALDQGAAFAVIDEKPFATDSRCLLVEDVLTSLQELAKFHRIKLGLPILAITGTNGKTTTKELVATVLSKKYAIEYTRGNLNNHIGVPLTLLSMTDKTEMGIVEMGANHPGEIDFLCQLAQPNYGLITNVGKAHLEGFGSFEGVMRTKGEMYRFLESNGGKVFRNLSNSYLSEMARDVETIGYCTSNMGQGIEGRVVQAAPSLVFEAKFPKGWLYFKTHLAGAYNLENALAAVCIGNYFGVDPLKMVEAIGAYYPSNSRSQMMKTENNQILLDAYNANPTSMSAALENFRLLDHHPKGVILGDMLELGAYSHEEHQRIVDLIGTIKLERVFLVGKEFSLCSLPESFLRFENSDDLADHFKQHPLKDHLFLVKGSRGIKLEKVLGLL